MNNSEIQQLRDTIKKLETRLSNLEKAIEATVGKITLKAGNSSIAISPVSVIIKSNNIELSASGKITVKASGDLTMKGAKILQN
jgi:type VI secretion system secreted protein VgrG